MFVRGVSVKNAARMGFKGVPPLLAFLVHFLASTKK
jgi:hypothetical protein